MEYFCIFKRENIEQMTEISIPIRISNGLLRFERIL